MPDLRWMIVCLLALAILIGAILAWPRLLRRGAEHRNLRDMSEVVRGVPPAKGRFAPARMPAGPAMQGSPCRFVCSTCGRGCWSGSNAQAPVCPFCRRSMTSQGAGFAAAPDSRMAVQAHFTPGSPAQAGAALPIQEGEPSPHSYSGPCANCHVIMPSPQPSGASMTQVAMAASSPTALRRLGPFQVPELAMEALGIEGEGVSVYRVYKGSSAEKGGLAPGDTILKFNGKRVQGATRFVRMVSAATPELAASVEIARNGRILTRSVMIGEGEMETATVPPDAAPIYSRLAGSASAQQAALSPGPFQVPELAMEALGIEGEGVSVYRVYKGSSAEQGGLAPGDTILSFNGKPVQGITGFIRMVSAATPELAASVEIARNGRILTRSVMIGEGEMETATVPPDAAPICSRLPGSASMQPVALSPAMPAPGLPDTGTLPSPTQQNAAKKEFIEGHWLGLEVIPLTPELATEYRIPKGEKGLLVDEITLESAESGILAGDMVHAIDGYPTPNLEEFLHATVRVKTLREARVEVARRGRIMTFVMRARNTPELGFAQMEAAQPIQPGALSPHRSRGRPCTVCHIIMQSGGQLPTDAGDILPNPGPIPMGAPRPHAYRGPCNTCHQIVR